jgi:hypothetical protein
MFVQYNKRTRMFVQYNKRTRMFVQYNTRMYTHSRTQNYFNQGKNLISLLFLN